MKRTMAEFVNECLEESAETDTFGTAESQFWHFVRHLSAIRTTQPNLKPKALFDQVERALSKEHKQPWFHHFDLGRDEAEVKFLSAWERIRFIPGTTPLDSALIRAKAQPLSLTPEIEAKRPSYYPTFITLCGWLQHTAGDRNIMLPCRKLGELLTMSPMTISRLVVWAVQDKYLSLMQDAMFRSAGGSRAAEYRFDITRYRCFFEAAPTQFKEAERAKQDQ